MSASLQRVYYERARLQREAYQQAPTTTIVFVLRTSSFDSECFSDKRHRQQVSWGQATTRVIETGAEVHHYVV